MANQAPIFIKGGRLVNPATGMDDFGELFIENGLIQATPETFPDNTIILDAQGMLVTPGFIDIHVHLREPGKEEAETIESGSRAAARGGFTTVVAMPNTSPPLDTPERVAWVLEQGNQAGHIRVMTTGCITRDRAGNELADMQGMAEAGAVAFTDDGCTVQSDALMRQAMELASRENYLIMDHAQDREIELRGGVMHEGLWSRKWNIPGIPTAAEIMIIERDIHLSEVTRCRTHIQHVSSGEGVRSIGRARERGVPVTGECSPHHLVLVDEDVQPDNALFKMNPPLRGVEDRETLQDACLNDILHIFATDHAPHTAGEKARGLLHGPFGVVGLETAIGITYTTLVLPGRMTTLDWVRKWTVEPAAIIGIEEPSLAPGTRADVVLINVNEEWEVDPATFRSRSQNTPFAGRKLYGSVRTTLCGGRNVWDGTSLTVS